MKRVFWRYLTVIVGSAFLVTIAVYVFNLLVFSYIPHLRRLVSPNEALFYEGLLTLTLGALILLELPSTWAFLGGRRRLQLGSGLATNTKSQKDRAKNIQAVGFALIIASIVLFLLYSSGIY